ncbi:hypothetical protein M072_3807 [Bacteroides fragilis str. DS-208]|jgi:hypothetical protein|nr:hypothetical protein M072_3807 [Bacteroides fragilis str. DS-208]
MEDFRKLVLKYYKQKCSLSLDADKSTKDLSLVVKNVSGKTIGQWLDDYNHFRGQVFN